MNTDKVNTQVEQANSIITTSPYPLQLFGGKRFGIHKEGHEGVLVVVPQGNGNTAMIDRTGGVPEWAEAERIVAIDLLEHRQWYVMRCGDEFYSKDICQSQLYEVSDFKLDALDEEGDLVAIEPNYDARGILLANRMNLDKTIGLTAEDFDNMEDAGDGRTVIAVAETEHEVQYAESAEDLQEAQEQGFERDKKAATGTHS